MAARTSPEISTMVMRLIGTDHTGLHFEGERPTGIEPASSAWQAQRGRQTFVSSRRAPGNMRSYLGVVRGGLIAS